MKCQVCKIKEAQKNSIVCSDSCNDTRLKILKLVSKHAPTNGCENCWGDTGTSCTPTCKEEFIKAHELIIDVYDIVRSVISGQSTL